MSSGRLLRLVCALALLAVGRAPTASAYNILVVATLGARSHFIWTDALTRGLLDHGHTVTDLTVMEPEPHPNRTNFVIENAMISEDVFTSTEKEASPFDEILLVAKTFPSTADLMVESQGFKRFRKYLQENKKKYDLFLIDIYGQQTFLSVASWVGRPPIVVMTPYNNPLLVSNMMDNPGFPAIAPFETLSIVPPMNFWTRVYNTLVIAFHDLVEKWTIEPKIEEHIQRVYGPGAPTYAELREDIALALVNSNPATHLSRPLLPNIVEVGQLHVADPKPLPQDLKSWLDSAPDGVILMSFGSSVNPAQLGTKRLQAIANALGRLRQKVIWKLKEDLGVKIPANVRIHSWLPQSDILGHPSVRMVVTHGGTLSRQEAAQRGKPMVTVPFLMDQYSNSFLVQHMGVGLRLTPNNITEENFYAVITEVLNNPKYARNAARLAETLRLDPIRPLERAVRVVEQVAALGGAPHLRSPARDVSSLQLHLVDVVALLGATALAAVVAVVWLVRSLLQSGAGKSKAKQKRQ